MIISSRTNLKLKHLRHLQQKKYRRQTGHFVLEGLELLQETQRSGYQILQLFRRVGFLCPALQAVAAEDYELNSDLITYVSALKSPPDVLAVLQSREIEEDCSRYPAWLITEGLQDPGNFGALLRLVEAMNWRGVLTIGEHPDPLQLKVIRGSMGSSLRMPVKSLSLEALTVWKRDGWTLLGTAADAAGSSFQIEIPRKLLLALGHEGQGLSPELKNLCHDRVAIPIHVGVDSLNVVTAAAMLVHESNRQWILS